MRLGSDVGGTFTDLVLDDHGVVRVAKVPSTPNDQAAGLLHGVATLGVDPSVLDRLAHGTTVATNTVLERDGARTVLLVTQGFRDVLTIGRQDRPSLYDQSARRAAPVVPAPLTIEIAERIAADGSVVLALTDDEVERVTAAVAAADAEAVAICLLFAFADDRHEQRLAAALEPLGVPVSRSSDVLAVFREYERASTTALNAYVAPRMSHYLGSLEHRLGAAGAAATVDVMRSGGGTFGTALAARYPVNTLLSGPAAGAWGAAAVGRAAGFDDLIAFDMGGTSTDVTLIRDGQPAMTAAGRIADLPFAVPTTDIHTVGAGGGSIGWLDAGGALRVGPRSAGADPGPACYGRGGSEPTVTDANVHLGRLDADTRLGGAMRLDLAAASRSLEGLAAGIGGDLDTAAEGVLQVVEATMVRALRVVSVERGHDPREFTLVAFGGAGGLHQAALAADLGCRRVLVPPHAGVLSALGLVAAPPTVDEVVTVMTGLDAAAGEDLRRRLAVLEERARATFAMQREPVATVSHAADVRYRGQAHELTVPLVDGDPATLAAAFHAAHRSRYGYEQPDAAIEVVSLRIRLQARQPELPLGRVDAGRGGDAALVARRRLRVDGRERDVPVYGRPALGAGDTLRGPAIVTAVDATCWIAPWQQAVVDDHGGLVLTEAAT